MSSSKNKGPAMYTHWSRPRTRMYDYNYQVAEGYYKPQVRYIGPTTDSRISREARRRSVSPPGPRTFLERWVADPFYGRTVDIHRSLESSAYQNRASSMVRSSSVVRSSSMVRSSSNPNLNQWSEYDAEMERQRNIRSSVSRARSVVNYEGGEYEDYANMRRSRARSTSITRPLDDVEVLWEWERDREFDQLARRARRDEREKSVFSYRMALDPDPKKVIMSTTLSHGCYNNTLYGTETWDPLSYLPRRQ